MIFLSVYNNYIIQIGWFSPIAVQAWNMMHQMLQKTTVPNSSGELVCEDRISKDILRKPTLSTQKRRGLPKNSAGICLYG